MQRKDSRENTSLHFLRNDFFSLISVGERYKYDLCSEKLGQDILFLVGLLNRAKFASSFIIVFDNSWSSILYLSCCNSGIPI